MMTSNFLQYGELEMALLSRSDFYYEIFGVQIIILIISLFWFETLFHREFPKHSLLSEMTNHNYNNHLFLLTTYYCTTCSSKVFWVGIHSLYKEHSLGIIGLKQQRPKVLFQNMTGCLKVISENV